MDDQRFDAWTRRFATRSSRRRFLSRLGATLAGGFGASLIERPVPANAACPPDQVQRRGIGCVCKATGRPPDAATGECPCPDGQIRCGGVCVDPTRDMANCGSCGVTCPSSTDPCLVAACRKGVCTTVPAKIGTPCDDGNGCTANDVCQGDGTCAGTPVVCAPLDQCHSAACDLGLGCVQTVLQGAACDDGDPCTLDDACDGDGVCVSGPAVSCVHLDSACLTGVCDPATGACASVPKNDGTPCDAGFAGVCCGGQCSQCCDGDTSTCGPAPEANMTVACVADQAGAGRVCEYTCLTPANNPACIHPVLAVGAPYTCLPDSGQATPCLLCRLPVLSPCTDDTQCCGLCVDGTCEDGLEGSYCLDSTDCFSGLLCHQSACVPPLPLGAACDPAVSACAAGTSCGRVIGATDVCCLAPDSACAADADCCQVGGGERRCVLGTCSLRQDVGGDCAKDTDCKVTLTCLAGVCGTKAGLGGACDTDADCAFDAASNTQPVCSAGLCMLPNGAACTSGGQCAIGTCVECSYGHVCGNCCTRNESGIDEFFCGDAQSLKICCNNQCVRSYESTHCGTCNYDCTCGGADPLRYCSYEDYGAEFEVDRYRFYCDGHYDLASGHCDTTSGDICSSPPNCDENCDCQHISEPGGTSLDCWSQCVGQAENIEIPGFCAKDGNQCLDGDDSTCCTDTSLCVEDTNCSSGAIFCLSSKYICVAGT